MITALHWQLLTACSLFNTNIFTDWFTIHSKHTFRRHDMKICIIYIMHIYTHNLHTGTNATVNGRSCIAVNETPSHSYRVSLAIWDHKVLPVTRHNCMNTPHLNPSQTGQYLIYLPLRDGRLSWPRWLVTYRDGLLAHRRSPIQVLTRQCMAGNRTRNLLITSATP